VSIPLSEYGTVNVQLPAEVADLFLLYLEQRLWEVWGAGRPRLVAAAQTALAGQGQQAFTTNLRAAPSPRFCLAASASGVTAEPPTPSPTGPPPADVYRGLTQQMTGKVRREIQSRPPATVYRGR
jgi:hypothetical protein